MSEENKNNPKRESEKNYSETPKPDQSQKHWIGESKSDQERLRKGSEIPPKPSPKKDK